MSTRAKILLKVVLTAALLAFLLARMDLTEFANVLISADPLLVLIAANIVSIKRLKPNRSANYKKC